VGLFSRWRASAPDADAQLRAISAFWTWWGSSGAADTAGALEAGDPDRVAPEIARHVEDIDGRLTWGLTTGSAGRHVLVVTSNGDPELRAVARRWRRAAPASTGAWDYADARPPAEDPDTASLEFDGTRIAVGDVSVSARVVGPHVVVGLFHPSFADLSDEDRAAAAFLLLEHVLGETDTETWVGSVEGLTLSPLDPVPLATLPSVVQQLRTMHTGGDGRPTWMLLEGQTPDGHAVVAAARVPAKPVIAPELDTHVAVAVPFTDQQENGLPGPGSLQALRDLEDHLTGRLGDSGLLVAHQTHEGLRLLHFYVDSTTPAAEQLRAAVSGWDQGTVRIQDHLDPAWEAIAHLRG
jgi:hypothetical protein